MVSVKYRITKYRPKRIYFLWTERFVESISGISLRRNRLFIYIILEIITSYVISAFLFFILYSNHFRTLYSDCYKFSEWFVSECDGRLRSVAPRRPWQASLVPLSSASQLWRHRARAPPTHPLSPVQHGRRDIL